MDESAAAKTPPAANTSPFPSNPTVAASASSTQAPAAPATSQPAAPSSAKATNSAPAAARQAAKSPADKLPRTPHGEWATRVPAVSEYIAAVPSEQVAAWQEFQQEFPQADPTESEDFYAVLLKKRQSYGRELNASTSAQYAAWLGKTTTMRKALVMARGNLVGVAIAGTDEPSDTAFMLTGFAGTAPLYDFTQNVNAAISVNANLVRMNASFDPTVGTNITGAGLYVNVNDAGLIDEHDEMQLPGGGSRIIHKGDVPNIDPSYLNSLHATHVAGTVGAWGYNTNVIGMAPRVWFRSFVQQATTEIYAYGMSYPGQSVDGSTANPRDNSLQIRSVIGTTSLGRPHDYNTTVNYCVYNSTCATYDQAMWDNPYYIHFFAAGNYANKDTNNPTVPYFATLSVETPNCKNMTAIAAAVDATRDAAGNLTGGGTNTYFSSRGPTFDGRIKPDLTGNGANVNSTIVDTNNTDGDGNPFNGTYSAYGTSMATPNVSGATALLVDYFNKRFPGHYMRSSTLRALMINTADDRGNAGPDYGYGWGLVNIRDAAEIIKRYADAPTSRVVVEDALPSNSSTYTATYTSDGSKPIRATLAWIDPAGKGISPSSSDRSSRLVNDLDIRIIGPAGTTNYPYVMPFVTGLGTTPAFDESLYDAPATTGDNTTDNVEQILIPAPASGTYTVQITRSTTVTDDAAQKFSLAVSGMEQTTPVAPSISSITPSGSDGTDSMPVSVNGSGFLLGSDVIFRNRAYPDITATGIQVTGAEIKCLIDTTKFGTGRWDVIVRSPDGSETVLPKGFLNPIPATIYANYFENPGDAAGFTGQGQWQVGAPNYAPGTGPSGAVSGTKILGYNLSGTYGNNIPAYYATTPAIDCSNASGVRLSFWRWLGVERTYFWDYEHPEEYPEGWAYETWDNARVYVSSDGVNWTRLWANDTTNPGIKDTGWVKQEFDISSVADGRSTVYVRWSMGPTDGSAYGDGYNIGWNIDNIEITGSVDEAPEFTSTPPATAKVGRVFTYHVATADPSAPWEDLSLSASGLPAWLTFTDNGDGTGTLSGTPLSVGSASFTLSVTDGAFTAQQSVTLSIVDAGAANIAPAITTSVLPSASSAAYSATVRAFDVEGTAIALSASGLPAWLTFTDNGDGTGTLSGTAPAGNVGTFEITITASDDLASSQRVLSLVVDSPVLPAVTVAATDATASETGPDSGTFTFTRTGGDMMSPLTVGYSLGGTATSGADYSAPGRTVTFSPFNTTATITITPVDDEHYETPEESVEIAVAPGAGYTVGLPDSATVVISDNDKPTVSVFLDPSAMTEGGTSTFTFARSGINSLGPLTVNYTLGGTTTAVADYSPALSGSITIPVGETTASLDINAPADSVIEVPETLILTVSANAAYNVAAAPNNVATLTISDPAGQQSVVTIAVTDNETSERADYKGGGRFTLTRAGSIASAISVNILASGTATPGSDYTALPASVTIPAGQYTATFDVTVLDDSEAEPDETVTATLQVGTGYTLGVTTSRDAIIYDDEPTQIRAEVGDSKCLEQASPDSGTIILRRLGSREAAITVPYAVTGTATNGTDYTSLSGSASISAGTSFATLTITPTNDSNVEGTETVTVTAGTGTGYALADPASATLEIRDDETVDVNVSVFDATCKEQASPDAGTFRLTRSASSASALTVNYTLTGTATNGTDYTLVAGSATIPANQTTVDVTTTPTNDALAEGTESVILTLAANGAAYDLGDNRAQTMWIQDDESPSLTLAASDANAGEADGASTNPGLFTVTVSSAPASDLTVPYTIGGSALNGIDYARISGSAVIPAGQTSVTVPVDIVDDDLGEGSETVQLTLGQVTGYNTATTGSVTVTVAASDLPVVNVIALDDTAAENPLDTAQFLVTLSKPSAANTSITYATSGTATSGSDYTALGITTINAGLTSATVTLTPVNDTDSEGPETATVAAAASASYTVGASATATITDDESDGTQTLAVNPSTLGVVEGGTATFEVRLGTAPAATTTVSVAKQSGDSDITLQSGASLTFTPANWSTPQTVTLAAASDADAVNGTAVFIVSSPARPSLFVTATERDIQANPDLAITGTPDKQVILPDLTDSLMLEAVTSHALGTPSVAWTQVSGPAGQTASFADAAAATTGATFPAAGIYVLRATATISGLASTSDLTVYAGNYWGALVGGDLGTPGKAGSHTVENSTYTLRGAGSDMAGTADHGYFLGTAITGNFSVTTRIVSQTNDNAWAKAGLMIRQTTASNSQCATLLMTPSNGVTFQYRASAGASAGVTTTTSITAPSWLRIIRNGTTVSAWRSPDGITWTQVGTNQTVSLADPVLVGLAMTSHNTGILGTAVFDNLRIDANCAPQVNPGNAPSPTVGVASALGGSASDDGQPSGSSLVTTWSKASGPGTVTFADANELITTATFSAPGDYVLRLSATDGSAAVFQDLAVTATGSAYDTWIAGHPSVGAKTGKEDDPDGDGLSNLAEYALGGDPTQAQAGKMPAGGQAQVASDKFLTLTFNRARADVNYIVEGTSDLSNPSGWSEIGRNPGSVGQNQTVADTVPMNAQNPKRFLRLKLVPQ